MTVYQILCLVGIPSLITGAIAFVIGKVQGVHKRMTALEKGVQAILRTGYISHTTTTWNWGMRRCTHGKTLKTCISNIMV